MRAVLGQEDDLVGAQALDEQRVEDDCGPETFEAMLEGSVTSLVPVMATCRGGIQSFQVLPSLTMSSAWEPSTGRGAGRAGPRACA